MAVSSGQYVSTGWLNSLHSRLHKLIIADQVKRPEQARQPVCSFEALDLAATSRQLALDETNYRSFRGTAVVCTKSVALTCWRDEAESSHMVLQVASEQHNLLRVEAHAAGVGRKDCCGQQLAQVCSEVSRQGWAGQNVGGARVPRARHKNESALFLQAPLSFMPLPFVPASEESPFVPASACRVLPY